MKRAILWIKNSFGIKKSKDIAEAYNNVFNINNKEVALVLKDLSIYCNFTNTSFRKGSIEETFFNEGARDVFLHILEMSNIDIKEILKLHDIEI